MQRVFLIAAVAIPGITKNVAPGSPLAVLGQPVGLIKSADAVSAKELTDFKARMLAVTTRHLDLLLDSESKVSALKGKSADGATALAYYQAYELTSAPKYRAAALELADRIVKDMKATKHGVLYIKQKGTGEEAISGGGPPAFGWYTASAAYILHKEGGRNDDIKYIAKSIDNFPWNKNGWWANTVDIETGQPKAPLARAGAINKSAAMALCAAMVSGYVKSIDPELSTRLRAKADQCVYRQILPAQETDGFWHYGFKGTDPKNKDVLGYFMVTTAALIQLQHFTDSYRDRRFQSALDKACAFAARHIAPMTDPNRGVAPPGNRTTAGTPTRYMLADEPKRGFQLGILLFAGGHDKEGLKIMDCALKHFATGNAGTDGAHAVQPCALMLALLEQKGAGPKPGDHRGRPM